MVDVAVGYHQTLFVRSDGTLWGMGNLYGTGMTSNAPIQLASGVKTVAAGSYHSLILKLDGTLWTLGANGQGQLGTGDTSTRTVPVQIATGVKLIAAGYTHSAFIKTDSSLWMCGSNDQGQLGDGTNTNRSTPFQVATNVTNVSASQQYTLFTKTDGSLWGTGLNGYGEFGNHGEFTPNTPVFIQAGAVAPPSVPVIVSGGPNANGSRVELLWQPGADATSYEIWRSTTNSFGTATRIAQDVHWAFYQDTTASPSTSYYYWIKAVNPGGTSAPSASRFGAYGPGTQPVFNTQPSPQSIYVGGTANFVVAIGGFPDPTVQWQRLAAGGGFWTDLTNGGSYSGVNTTTLTVSNATLGMSGEQFRCYISNSYSWNMSNVVALTVTPITPIITSDPVNREASPGGSPTFTISVTGAPTPTLQWQRSPAGGGGWSDLSNGGSYAGVTTTTLTVSSLTVGMSGDQFRCVATNIVGTATSNRSWTPRPSTTSRAASDRRLQLRPAEGSHLGKYGDGRTCAVVDEWHGLHWWIGDWDADARLADRRSGGLQRGRGDGYPVGKHEHGRPDVLADEWAALCQHGRHGDCADGMADRCHGGFQRRRED